MHHYRYIIFLFVCLLANIPFAVSQQKKTPVAATAVAEDIFSDLPINDPSANSILGPGENAEEKIKKNIFVSGAFNKTTCYVGEPVLLSFELLSALKSNSNILRLPSFDGFMVIFMDPNNEFPKFRKKDGLEFSVFTVKQLQLIPDKEGNMEIGAITVNNNVEYVKDKKKYTYSGVVESKPEVVHVKHLPTAGRPGDFSGIIGNFDIQAFVKHDSIPVGENNSLEIEIAGSGNFYSLKIPPVYWPTGFHNFDQSEKLVVDEKLFPVNGKKVISIPFIAEQEGSFLIPSVKLNFFDPVENKYKESVTNDIHLVVIAPLPLTGSGGAAAAMNREHAKRSYTWLYLTAGILFSLMIIFLLIIVVKKNSKRKEKQIEEAEKKTIADAAEVAMQEKERNLKAAIAELDDLVPDQKYIFRFKQALIDYLHFKLGVANALPEEMIQAVCEMDLTTGEQLKQLIENSDMLLYADISPDAAEKEKLLLLLHAVVKKMNDYKN